MTSRLSAWLARSVVVAAAFALPLCAAGPAQAAMAGANPGVTTDRPDLMSATIISSSEVQVCFDKPVTVVDPTAFFVDGYDAENYFNSSATYNGGTAVDGANNHCVDAMYDPSTIGDIDQFTAVNVNGIESGDPAVAYGSVPSSSNENHDDSTALTGSDTHNGTTGLTGAPDLTGIASPTSSEISSNSLVFEFDQAVYPTTGTTPPDLNASDIYILNDAHSYCKASSASVIPNTGGRDVLATFPSTCFSVTQAIEGDVYDNAVSSANDMGLSNPMETVPTPFAPNGGVPIYAPYLVSATLDASNPDAIDYTFNQPVAVDHGHEFCYAGAMAESQHNCAPQADVTNISQTVVQATFGGMLAKEQEYAVLAQVYDGGVVNASGFFNGDQSTKVGDNAGAFARGFTTAPDVTAVTFNQSNDQATVDVDQRLCTALACPFTDTLGDKGPVDTSGIYLLPSFGNPTTPYDPISYSVTNPDQAAGPQQVVLQFAPVNSDGRTFGSQAMILFDYCEAFEASAQEVVGSSNCDAWNAQQVDEPISSGAVLSAIRYNRAHARGGGVVRRHHRVRRHRSHKR